MGKWSSFGAGGFPVRFLLLLLAFIATAHAEDVTPLPGLTRESMTLHGPHGDLEALVVRPATPGRYPLALITHGLPRDPAQIQMAAPQGLLNPAIAFAQRGYAAVIVMRAGYGQSEGPFREQLGPCEDRDYLKAAAAGASDVNVALDRLRGEAWVDPAHILLIGHSMGGFVMLAAGAADPPGVRGIISFAGAVGSPRPDFVCQPDRLIAADAAFGQTTRIPGLWIFAENDHFFAPDLARAMINAYTEHGAPADLFIAPPYDDDGHGLIYAPPETSWWPRVASFLESIRMPVALMVTLPPMLEPPPPPVLNEAGQRVFPLYRTSRSFEKAWATDAEGHWGVAYGRRTQADAADAAIRNCQIGGRICRLYAIGNQVRPP